ncbi:MAG: LamG domain-containing protein [Candidatus Woesearchaeota archaeon]
MSGNSQSECYSEKPTPTETPGGHPCCCVKEDLSGIVREKNVPNDLTCKQWATGACGDGSPMVAEFYDVGCYLPTPTPGCCKYPLTGSVPGNVIEPQPDPFYDGVVNPCPDKCPPPPAAWYGGPECAPPQECEKPACCKYPLAGIVPGDVLAPQPDEIFDGVVNKCPSECPPPPFPWYGPAECEHDYAKCAQPFCGDGIINQPNEECEPPNTIIGQDAKGHDIWCNAKCQRLMCQDVQCTQADCTAAGGTAFGGGFANFGAGFKCGKNECETDCDLSIDPLTTALIPGEAPFQSAQCDIKKYVNQVTGAVEIPPGAADAYCNECTMNPCHCVEFLTNFAGSCNPTCSHGPLFSPPTNVPWVTNPQAVRTGPTVGQNVNCLLGDLMGLITIDEMGTGFRGQDFSFTNAQFPGVMGIFQKICCGNPKCGDGKIDNEEQCDPPGTKQGDLVCSYDCKWTQPWCGNGIVDPGEECDIGIYNPQQYTAASHPIIDIFLPPPPTGYQGTPPSGYLKPSGYQGTPPQGYLLTGTGYQSTPTGAQIFGLTTNTNAPNAVPRLMTSVTSSEQNCGPDCKWIYCGDGITQPENNELCDPPNGETCFEGCTTRICRENILPPASGLPCSPPGSQVGLYVCSNSCTWTYPGCGDGIIEPPEECESDSDCPTGEQCNTCACTSCGNGVLDPGEICEPPGSSCTQTSGEEGVCSDNCYCTVPYCGDGNIGANEQCEPPGTGTCNYDCTNSICGDGKVGPDEQCDGTPGCDNNCMLTCGNGVLDEGEACDESVSGMESTCQYCRPIMPPTCGNSIIETGEGCDPPDGINCDSSCQPIPCPMENRRCCINPNLPECQKGQCTSQCCDEDCCKGPGCNVCPGCVIPQPVQMNVQCTASCPSTQYRTAVLSPEQETALRTMTNKDIISVIEVSNCCPEATLRFTESLPNNVKNIETFVVSGSTIKPLDELTGSGVICGGRTTDQLYEDGVEVVSSDVGGDCTYCMRVPPGLISWWPGDRHTNDLQSVNHGTLMLGATANIELANAYEQGIVGKAFKLDGVDDYIIVQHRENLNPADQITIAGWVKADEWQDGRILQKDNQYRLFVDSGYMTFALDGIANGVVKAPAPVEDLFHFIAATYDGQRLMLYIDGIEMAEQHATGTISTSLQPLYIGATNEDAPYNEHFKGLIDELQIYNRALTSEEVKAEWAASNNGKCKPHCYGYVQWYTVQQLDMRLIQEKTTGTISSDKPLFTAETTLGELIEISMMQVASPVTIAIEHPRSPVPVANPEMRVITAFEITLENYAQPETIQLSVPVPADDPAAGLFIRFGETWQDLDGSRIGNKLVAKLTAEQISQFFSTGTQMKALFAVLSLVKPEEVADQFTQVYDGGGSSAVIFVQGITTSRVSIKKFVHEYQAAKDASKVYAYYYTPTKQMADIARDLAEQASSTLLKDGITEAYLVPYSFGGLVAQDALTYAKQNGLALATMTKKVIYIGTPFGGSKLLEVWNRFFAYLLNTRISAGLFNVPSVHPEIAGLLVTGKQEKEPSVDAEYGLVIGTRSYPWAEQFFNTVNDGVVQDPDAHPQWFVERQTCDPNVLRVHLTHDQLPGAYPVRDFVYKVTNKERSEADPNAALLGYSQSVDITHKGCKSGDMIVVVGEQVPEEERAHYCSCGDGVCGAGENFKNCPQDCTSIWQKFNMCLYLPWLINALLVLLLIVSTTYIYRKEKTHERGTGFVILTIALAVILGLILVHYLKCGYLLPLAIFLLMLILAIIIMALLHFRKPKPGPDLDRMLRKLRERLQNLH